MTIRLIYDCRLIGAWLPLASGRFAAYLRSRAEQISREDGRITLLEAVDSSKGKGRDLARVIRPPPPRKAKPASKKTAAAAAKSATSTARGAPPASGRRQQAGDSVTPPGNSVRGKQAGKSDTSYVAVAIGVALLAIFVAKAAASLIFQ